MDKLASTVLTLFFIPAIYSLFDRKHFTQSVPQNSDDSQETVYG